MLAIWCM